MSRQLHLEGLQGELCSALGLGFPERRTPGDVQKRGLLHIARALHFRLSTFRDSAAQTLIWDELTVCKSLSSASQDQAEGEPSVPTC